MQRSDRQIIKKKYTSGKPGNVLEAAYFYYDTAPKDYKDLAIVCGGYEKCAPDFEINRSKYPYYFVKFTVKGRGTLQIDTKTLPLRPGILTGFAPGTPHHYKADPKNPMEHIFITFIGDECPNLFRKSRLADKHHILIKEPDKTFSLFNKILNLGLEKNDYSHDLCCAYLRILLLEQASLLAQHSMNCPISRGTYQECKKYIDASFSSIKSPGEVADHCSIDVRYLSVLFKRYCHISPGRYLMRLKLNKAVNLLLTSDLSIKEIASQIGFQDPYHFSKNFKKLHGRSPNNYRADHMRSLIL